ncbi:RNA binding protein associated with pre-50S ribosomal subunits [Gammaproteobacteria bacterium]|nr:RNA binding protein associated with pre-50S ribosomal subunits [Gammaproteobacteria bacterium]
MTQIKLSKEQRQYLKSLAHHLKPVILIGDKGITDTVITECKKSIAHHELMKIRISGADREARNAAIVQLEDSINATVIQKIGHVVTFFRRNHAEPKISFTGI